MTVSSQTPYIRYVFDGTLPLICNFSFKVYRETDITVYRTYSLGNTTVLVLNTNYRVALTNDGLNGGVVTVYDAVGSAGFVTIERHLPRTQETDWVNNDPFSTELLETDLDRLVMIIQEYGFELDQAATYVAWKGDWTTGIQYHIRDMVEGPDLNIYTCMVEHQAGVFVDDLASGFWALMISVGDMEGIAEAAAASAAEAAESAAAALASANAAAAYAAAAQLSSDEAENSEAVAADSEVNAANCSVAAHDSSVESYHWAQYPEDSPVPESHTPPEYSAYHWSKKAEIVANPVLAVTGTAPVTVSGGQDNRVIALTETDPIFVPPVQTPEQERNVVQNLSGTPTWGSLGVPNRQVNGLDGIRQDPTGNIYGGRLSWVSDDEFRVFPVCCMDDTLQIELRIETTTTINATSWGNLVFRHVFIVRYTNETIGIETDTNNDGSGITGITHKRYLGPMSTFGSGTLRNMDMTENFIHYKAAYTIFSGISQVTPERYDLSTVFTPYFRVNALYVLAQGTTGQPYRIFTDNNGSQAAQIYYGESMQKVKLTPTPYWFQGNSTYAGISVIAIDVRR